MTGLLGNPRIRLGLLSILGSTGILLLKWYAANLTGSAALRSDAMESIVNVVAGAFALGALVFAEQPADHGHPYGHGKIEYFSAVFEGGLVSLAAVLILYESVSQLIAGPELHSLDRGLQVNLVAGALNGLLGAYLVRQGRRHSSEALVADGKHILSDFVTTLGVVAGLALVWVTRLNWLDPVIGIGVALVLVRTGWVLVSSASGPLLDAQHPETIRALADVMARVRPREVINIHELRAIRSGRHTHVDVHIVVPEFFPVRRSHDLVDRFCGDVIREARLEGEFHSHVDPCARAYCRLCPVDACPIRIEEYSGVSKEITRDTVILPGPPEYGERS